MTNCIEALKAIQNIRNGIFHIIEIIDFNDNFWFALYHYIVCRLPFDFSPFRISDEPIR